MKAKTKKRFFIGGGILLLIAIISSFIFWRKKNNLSGISGIENINLKLDDLIIFFSKVKHSEGTSWQMMYICRITEIRDKAVKVDVATEPIHGSSGNRIEIYRYTAFIPKSVIVKAKDHYTFTVKEWFAHKFIPNFYIKKYAISNGKKVYV